jgi:hypothetical protein
MGCSGINTTRLRSGTAAGKTLLLTLHPSHGITASGRCVWFCVERVRPHYQPGSHSPQLRPQDFSSGPKIFERDRLCMLRGHLSRCHTKSPDQWGPRALLWGARALWGPNAAPPGPSVHAWLWFARPHRCFPTGARARARAHTLPLLILFLALPMNQY